MPLSTHAEWPGRLFDDRVSIDDMTRRYRLSREQHLRRRRDFDRVFADRCSAGDPRMVVYVVRNGLDLTRLGMSVSKRLGKAVQRNRIRRIIRESFRLGQHDIPTGMDIVCVAKAVSEPRLEDYQPSLVRLAGMAITKLKRRSARRPIRESG